MLCLIYCLIFSLIRLSEGIENHKNFLNFINEQATGLKFLCVSCWEINQVTFICQLDFLDKTCRSKAFRTPTFNFAYSNQSRYQISAKTNDFDYLDQICPEKIFPVENRKIELHY